MNAKILLVDDEEDILEFLGYNLEKEGYLVKTANNGQDAIKVAESFNPHLIILDIMMPVMDGVEACRQIRKLPNGFDFLILFLSARSEEFTEIAGFDAGGDDYVYKPIKPRVLLSRIKAVLKRKATSLEQETIIHEGGLEVNPNTYMIKLNGVQKDMPKKEFELLKLLASKPGKVYSREKILTKVWGTRVHVGDRTVDVHVRKIREKIGDDKIETIKGVGYKFKSVD